MMPMFVAFAGILLFGAGIAALLMRRELLASVAGIPLMAAGAILVAVTAPGAASASASIVLAGLALSWTLVAISAVGAHYRRRARAELGREEGLET